MFFWILLVTELPFGAGIIRFPFAVLYFWRSYLTKTSIIFISLVLVYLTYASFNITSEIIIVVACLLGLIVIPQANLVIGHGPAVHVLILVLVLQLLQILHLFPWQEYFLLHQKLFLHRPTAFSSEPSFFGYIFFYLAIFTILSYKVNWISATLIFLNVLVIIFFGAALTLFSMVAIALISSTMLYLASKIKHLVSMRITASIIMTLILSTFFMLEIGSRYYDSPFSEFILTQTFSWREFSTLQAFMGADIINWPRLGNWEEVSAAGSWSYSQYFWIDSPWSVSAVLLNEFGLAPTVVLLITSWRIYSIRTNNFFDNVSQITLFLLAILFGPKWAIFFFVNPLKLRPVRLI